MNYCGLSSTGISLERPSRGSKQREENRTLALPGCPLALTTGSPGHGFPYCGTTVMVALARAPG